MTKFGAATAIAVVSTIHKVKGLEFDRVIIMPSTCGFAIDCTVANMGMASAEEARLFYVAGTRAKTQLLTGLGPREYAWWKGEKWSPPQHGGLQLLDGTPDEVVISWAALPGNGGGEDVLNYLESCVGVDDPVILTGREIYHQQGTQSSYKIGVLKKQPGSSSAGLRVAAVLRFPQ